MKRFREQLPGIALEERRIGPSGVGGQAIGHVRFYNRAFTQTLWPLAADWFNREFPVSESVGTPARHEPILHI